MSSGGPLQEYHELLLLRAQREQRLASLQAAIDPSGAVRQVGSSVEVDLYVSPNAGQTRVVSWRSHKGSRVHVELITANNRDLREYLAGTDGIV